MFSLAVASTTLSFGRLIDIYSGRYFYIFGLIWLAIWSLILGFIKNEIMLNLARAFQGIGASAMLPSGLMLMGTIYRPGTRKNMAFSIYGACAPFGFFLGLYHMLFVYTSLLSALQVSSLLVLLEDQPLGAITFGLEQP
jgi:MFS family permease